MLHLQVQPTTHDIPVGQLHQCGIESFSQPYSYKTFLLVRRVAYTILYMLMPNINLVKCDFSLYGQLILTLF